MPYFTQQSLQTAIRNLIGTASYMLRIWLTLKQMGLDADHPVRVDTSNSTDALKRLFGYGDPRGKFFIPFAHTQRYFTMMPDSARSIIQTNLNRWAESGSVVTVDPTSFLDIRKVESDKIEVRLGRNYPQGLGHGPNGFAIEENTRVSLPLVSWLIWYYRQSELPEDVDWIGYLRRQMMDDLHLSPSEMELIFVPEPTAWVPTTQSMPLSDSSVLAAVNLATEQQSPRTTILSQSYDEHILRVNSMVTIDNGPAWLNIPPKIQLQRLIENNAKAILLYGPPRTGKTRAVDMLIPRTDSTRETIQIHDGWGYDELVLGFRPNKEGQWAFEPGPLLEAITADKTTIVLDEINRTDFSQAIGEIFSLIEERYRGDQHSIRLRNGELFHIPVETRIICTMNTLDRSTEIVDDALFGRMAAVEFRPRVEDLHTMLQEQGVSNEKAEALRQFFATVQQYYPLGHGYFARFSEDTAPVDYYVNYIRPVLQKHLQNYRDSDLQAIDEKVDQLFG